MATHDNALSVRKFYRTKTLIVSVAVTLGISFLGSLPAKAAPAAPPSTPSTSSDAKAAWENSSHQAEAASEQVNGAKQAEVKSQQVASRAAADLTAARNKVASSQQVSTSAVSAVASYQVKLNAFANASFRGARLSQFSVILTATSAADFLDESTVVDRVAQDTRKTLTAAVAAKNAAATAKTAADADEAAAVTAKTQADQAASVAIAATVLATSKKAQLDAAVVTYQSLYNKLSAQEKAAAASSTERIRQESLRIAAGLESQAHAAAAAAKQDLAAAAPAAGQQKAQVRASTSGTAVTTTPATVVGGDAAGNAAAALALSKVGLPYVYGAAGPDAFDCSGLTSWAWAQQGISIPRASYEQANYPEVSLDQLQPGDLVTYYSPVSHVAIYVGGGLVVSAADEQLGIVLRPVSDAGPDATGHRVPRG